jgi:hypothetical protein
VNLKATLEHKTRGKHNELDFIQNLKPLLHERYYAEDKDTRQTRRKYVQYIHLTSDLHPNYTKNS